MEYKVNNFSKATQKLAQLLADEKVEVIHGDFHTAAFDPEKRVLYLPVLDGDISNNLYTMFVAHEVGHAIWTPAEGWHNAAKEIPNCPRSYINIIEDIRIEKLIRRKYNGLYGTFVTGYSELLHKDFFGIQNMDVNKLGFMNKLNLFSKCGNLLNIKFTEDEKKLVSMAMAVETWQDVIDVCRLLKEEVKKLPPNKQEASSEQSDKQPGQGEQSGDQSDKQSGQGEQSDQGDQCGEQSDQGESENGAKDSDQEAGYTGGHEHAPYDHDDTMTDSIFRQSESKIILQNNLTFSIKNKIVEQVVKDLTPKASKIRAHKRSNFIKYRTWLSKYDKIIQRMIAQFNMRKSAYDSKRNEVSKSGHLDPNKLYDYKFVDDIFKRYNITPDAVNHGFLVMLDHSASMRSGVGNTLIRDAVYMHTAILAEFCRKLKIPMEVYLWTTICGDSVRYNQNTDRDHISLCNYSAKKILDTTVGKDAYEAGMCELLSNNSYGMGGTPSTENLAVTYQLAKTFRQKHKVQKLHTVIMADSTYFSNFHHYGMHKGNYSSKNWTIKTDNNTYQFKFEKDVIAYNPLMHIIKDVSETLNFFIVGQEYDINFFIKTYCPRLKPRGGTNENPLKNGFCVEKPKDSAITSVFGATDVGVRNIFSIKGMDIKSGRQNSYRDTKNFYNEFIKLIA